MPLQCVTLTGADETVSHAFLVDMARHFPHAEFGILASAKYEDVPRPRFPSRAWRQGLVAHALRERVVTRLALHLCGRWVRELLLGEVTFSRDIAEGFQRVQLNFGGEVWPYDAAAFPQVLGALWPDKELIFQLDGVRGQAYLAAYLVDHQHAVPLFDTSAGRGLMPALWPPPFLQADAHTYALHGYAGGLRLPGFQGQIETIDAVAAPAPYWIDLESGLREDNVFSPVNALAVLLGAQPWLGNRPERRSR